MRHRPIGIGIQGLADALIMMKIPFEDSRAEQVNAEIFETIYNRAPGLHECHGAEFEKLYTKYETEGRGNATMKAQKLWEKIIESQIETGTPYMLYKDHANGKSNQ